MHEIHDHEVNPANAALRITTVDKPGPGGAHHRYEIRGFDLSKNPSLLPEENNPEFDPRGAATLLFQNGAIAEVGVNGITHEALISVVLDRLMAFQAGPYACHENDMAIAYLCGAERWLFLRTRERMARGVEGTMKV